MTTFQQRYMDSVQQQSLPITEARVITRASRHRQRRRSPKPLRVLAAASRGLAWRLALALAMLREIIDRAFRTRHAGGGSGLRTECVALVPID